MQKIRSLYSQSEAKKNRDFESFLLTFKNKYKDQNFFVLYAVQNFTNSFVVSSTYIYILICINGLLNIVIEGKTREVIFHEIFASTATCL